MHYLKQAIGMLVELVKHKKWDPNLVYTDSATKTRQVEIEARKNFNHHMRRAVLPSWWILYSME